MVGLRLLVVLIAVAASPQAHAAASAWAETEQTALRLIAAADAAGAGERLAAGLHFRLKPGWKIYWRSPGDAGFPPAADWAGSTNLADARLAWPAPQRFEVQGLQTLGYKDEVVLPVVVAPAEPGKAVSLRAKVAYLVCDDICVPYDAALALDLPAAGSRADAESASREAALIHRYAARVPALAGGALALLSAETTEVGSHGELRLRIAVAASSVQGPSAQAPSAQVPSLQEPSAAGADAQPPETAAPVAPPPPALRRPDAFVEGPPALSFGPPAVELGEGGRTALMRIAVAAPPGKPLGLAGERVTVTVVDGGRAIERTLTVAPAFASGGAPADASGAMPEWLAVLGLALLGGLILNLMPCVLPVLSIKLLAVLGHGGGAAREVRRGFLASAAGILASFLVLASAAVALQAAGRAAGWGLQFQEPAFLAAMAFVLVLFAANLWGRFEFRLPGGLATIAGAAGGHGLVGHFLTGAFATLLATPCSAPFLGTAVGFALARGPVEIYAVFAALGVGLAAPYLLIAAAPRLATSLPRPGAWMIKLRRVLSLALVATALWLLLVLAAQSGWIVAGLVFVMLAVAAAALWPLPEAGPRMRIASWVSVAALGILAVGGVLALPSLRPAVAPYAPGLFTESDGERDTFLAARRTRDADPIWRPFDRDAIEREVAGGRMVFVDVTADWCVTCRVNKAVVLDRGETRKLLAAPGVVAMRADWTRPDPSITAYLKSFGRYGIPFNAVYGPARPKGVALPELLTERAVREAFAQARGEGEAAPRVSRR